LPLAESPTNCSFGGVDGKTLFGTARTALYRLDVPIAGL
jgi:sugar lactone lactonase YvrE